MVSSDHIFETSASSGKGINELFLAVASVYVPKAADSSAIILDDKAPNSGGGGGCSC